MRPEETVDRQPAAAHHLQMFTPSEQRHRPAGRGEEPADDRAERAGARDENRLTVRHAPHDTSASCARQADRAVIDSAAVIQRDRLLALFLELVRIDSL